ncbi:nuclear RNA export factor 2-like protein [Corchorus olitorius]|uniref:Nuclear RNA export factor 2-like protein n=1 Tax=Corchorus olitorius TaxID=93759 RepID=A0A1R3KS32_9ROSI|nr:nuclear RNA export factor 2-like protein [Corchorus olitorius]
MAMWSHEGIPDDHRMTTQRCSYSWIDATYPGIFEDDNEPRSPLGIKMCILLSELGPS